MKMLRKKAYLILTLLLGLQLAPFIMCSKTNSQGRTFYVNNITGSDSNDGLSLKTAWKTLEEASREDYGPGDILLLCNGCTFYGKLDLKGGGSENNPVVVKSFNPGNSETALPIINAVGYTAAIQIKNGRNFEISDIEMLSDAGEPKETSARTMRYGVLITASQPGEYPNITLQNLKIHNIFATESVKDEGANPTSNRGMGIGIYMESQGALIKNIRIESCTIEMTGHTGIKINGHSTAYLDGVAIIDNQLKNIGGPGMVPSRCKNILVRGNVVDHSGYSGDPRMHARGSGIWPWTCNDVLIEKNKFMHARGKNDSHGVHIDFNCNNVVVQYNMSIDNAGGFVEILGNNRNCSYRYNISVNDGSRIKGQDGALAPGRILWTSGFAGNGNKKTGPFNSYIYNNTIYVKEDICSGFTIDTTSKGILIANNIFYLLGTTEHFPSGLIDPDFQILNAVFRNNLYNKINTLPETFLLKDTNPLTGDPGFVNPGGFEPDDYLPGNTLLITDKGVQINRIPGDEVGLTIGLNVKTDFLGNPIIGLPDIGAIEVSK